MKILLIEDDLEFAELIEGFLSSRSIQTQICDDPFKALVLDLNSYDLVLLDLGLPGIDGIELCKKFREKSKIPIIISSARSSVSDKVLGLQLGADDYLPKPYDPDELYARIISLIRRTKDFNQENEKPKKAFKIDENSRDIKYLDNFLYLTEAEYEVMSELVKSYSSIVSKEQLIYSSPSVSSDGKSLEMVISKIRNKIKPYSNTNHIVSLRGRGYRIVE
ncbi:response regulator transcription factor [Halarcobacter anaerophilus]|uniref:response regulator transcription factor n=1 Tax=Halarcobacter anaerophilus TaxID=877500 RepID=UPI0005C9464C|nr:response regulator transcription factor [Halarcobacter anaerophilus]